MSEKIDKLLNLLTSEVFETKQEIREELTNKWCQDSNTIFVCPYGSSSRYSCNFYEITGQKPTRLDCYLCKKD